MSGPDGKGIVGARGRTVWDAEEGRRRCTANSKQAQRRCKNTPPPGATTCRIHGAAAPQVQKAARRRLMDAVDPAMSALIRPLEVVEARAEAELAEAGAVSDETLDRLMRLRHQADSILDRTGYVRKTEIDVAEAKERLLERLLDRRDQGDDDG